MSPTVCAPHLRLACRECEPVRPEPVARCEETLDLLASLSPTTPPSNGRDTSDTAAALLTEAQINAGHRRVLNALWRALPHGMTDEQIQEATGLNPSTERPRRGELEAGGLVVDTGERGRTHSGRPAILWTLSPAAIRRAEARRNQRGAA